VPLRVPIREDAPLVAWLKELQSRQVALRRYEWSPLVQVQGWSDVPRGRPLFESLFVFENYPVDAALAERAGKLGIEEVRFLERTSYPLTVMVFPDEQLRLRASYDARRFDDAAISRMLDHLQTLLEGFISAPRTRLGDLTILSTAERRALVRAGTGAHAGPPDLEGLSDEELDLLLEQYLESGEGTNE
jgi:non-ribosomal peptide synthetase component F